MLTFTCPGCGRNLKVKDALAGKKGKCPQCGRPLTIPAAPAKAAAGPAKTSADREEIAFPPSPTSATAAMAEGRTLSPSAGGDLPTLPPLASADQQTHTGAASRGAMGQEASLPGADPGREAYSFLAPAQAQDELGRLGTYRVLKVLGQGGMGLVFQAADPQLERLVALKVMLPALAAVPASRERFLREARAAAAIEHDHIITIHQVGEDRGVPFVAMPLLKGEPLDERLKREGKLPVAETLRIGREAAEGLAAAHERGLIHRDIKPANIWLEGKKGRVKILDFGLARLAADTTHLTRTGAIVGTPAYMAPEQARAGSTDPRSDLFSLGCVLYRMVTGEMPFKGFDTLSLLASVALDHPVPPGELNSQLPPALSELVMKLLEKDPERRVASAQEVAQAIQTLERELPASEGTAPGAAAAAGPASSPTVSLSPTQFQPRPSPAPTPAGAPAKSRRKRALLIGAALLLVLIGGGVLLGQVILRITGKDGKERDIPLNPGDKIEIIGSAAQPPSTPPTPAEATAAGPSPYDRLRREDIPPELLRAAGRGDPNKAPAEIVAILGKAGAVSGHSFREDGSVGAIDLRPDGKALALGYNFGWKSRVTIWHAATGKETMIAKPDSGVTVPVPTFSHDGTLLAIKTAEKCDIWDVHLKRRWQPLSDKPYRLFCCAFTPDDHGVLIGSPDRGNKDLGDPLSLIPITGRQPPPDPVKFEQAACSVHALALSPDGGMAAAAGDFPAGRGHAFVKLWDVKTGKVLRTVAGPCGAFAFVAFSPDGNLLLTQQEWGGEKPGIFVHNIQTDKKDRVYKLHTVQPQDAAFSPDSRLAASCDGNGDVHVWDPVTGQNKRVIVLNTQHGARQVFWAPDGRHLIVRNEVGTVYILRLAPVPGG